MNRIDRLIIKARAAARHGVELLPSLIEHRGDSWTAAVYLGDGIPGHAVTVKRATYATEAAAVAYIRAAAEEYPNSRDVVIIIDDL